MSITKKLTYHHSITELGNLQLRIITNIIKDGKTIDKKYSEPVTPENVNNIDDWDDKSKEIVNVLINNEVKTAFENEKQTMTGIGLEEIITHDRTIEEDGKIAVRRITRIFDDGKEISKKYHRSWINPGDNPDNNDVISKELAKKLHTQIVVDSYKEKLNKVDII